MNSSSLYLFDVAWPTLVDPGGDVPHCDVPIELAPVLVEWQAPAGGAWTPDSSLILPNTCTYVDAVTLC